MGKFMQHSSLIDEDGLLIHIGHPVDRKDRCHVQYHHAGERAGGTILVKYAEGAAGVPGHFPAVHRLHTYHQICVIEDGLRPGRVDGVGPLFGPSLPLAQIISSLFQIKWALDSFYVQ